MKRKIIPGEFFKKSCKECGKATRFPRREGGGQYPARCRGCADKRDASGRLKAKYRNATSATAKPTKKSTAKKQKKH